MQEDALRQSDEAYHVPVLLQEAIGLLDVKPDGVYVDCTFGGGGHSRAILGNLGKEGCLVAFDQDEDAKQNLPDDDRLIFVPQNFRHLQRFLRLHGMQQVDGILADLGVSSHQFDEAERGFSTRYDADMDMRMDRRQPTTAFDILQTFSEGQLHKLFEQYGEVTNAKTLAQTIVEVRKNVSLKTIAGFKSAVHGVVKGNPHKYFAKVFQALRIEVNDEMGALREMLEQSAKVLKPGGRIAVITFHSIEDRIVKTFLKRGGFEEEAYNPFAQGSAGAVFKLVNKKPVAAGEEELRRNPRSRSAKLRVAERTDVVQ
ncbi:MAG: 16S rRNA (cytosine(1402)-N(4))-methyltransferase RsmH [Niabella sp.]